MKVAAHVRHEAAAVIEESEDLHAHGFARSGVEKTRAVERVTLPQLATARRLPA